MSSKFLAVLCLVLCAETFAVRELTGTTSKVLLQNQANAFASGSVTQVGQGTTQGSASAFSSASSQNEFATAIASAVAIAQAGDGGRAVAAARAAAEAFAVAVARAFAAAAVSIESDNAGGSGCVSASANARATAQATAAAFVDVLAQASNDINFASAAAAAAAIVTVTVDAFAAAEANACVNGVGRANVAASQLSQAIGVVYARVAAFAVAIVTPNVAKADITVFAQGKELIIATVDGRSETQVMGNASGRGSTVGVAGGRGG